ncbi:MAG TPA: AMP-binding protein [Acidimicrobiales bacterium]
MRSAPLRPTAATETASADETLGELVQRRARAHGERVYVEPARSDGVLTYASLAEWHGALAAAAPARDSTVAVSISDPLQCAAFLIGAVASGMWVAPLDPATPDAGPSGLGSLTARMGADLIVADRPAPADVPCRWVELTDLVSEGAANATGAWAEVRTTGEGGIVLSSSGTTGSPKVMRLGQDKLLHTARAVAAHHQLTEVDRGFNPLPLFHINAEVVGLLSTLMAGASLVLDDRFHRTGFWELVGDRDVTWINAVPAIISRLVELRPGETVPSGVRFVRSASAPLPVVTADRFEAATGLPIVETYGMTEAASQIAAHPLSVPRRAGSVGVPVGLELRVVRPDENGPAGAEARECPEAEVGEVEIRGASVIDAYEGGVHAERFRPGGWLRTGDLGRLDEDGYLYLVARTDDVINRGGEKVFPREIEEVISADPAVVTVAVIGQDDDELGQVPVAYVVLDGVDGPDDAPVAAHLAARINNELAHKLVRSGRPVALRVVASMPAGATGKVRRHALRALVDAPLFTFAVG